MIEITIDGGDVFMEKWISSYIGKGYSSTQFHNGRRPFSRDLWNTMRVNRLIIS